VDIQAVEDGIEGREVKLHLHLKAKYFDEIKAGIKTEEYRLYNDHWRQYMYMHREATGIIALQRLSKQKRQGASYRTAL
jgi:ASC-1-like (ASCH) protein